MNRLATIFGGVALMAFAPLAHASFVISYQVTGFAATTCVAGTDAAGASILGVSCSGTSGGVEIGATGQSNWPGTPSNANEVADVVTVHNTTGVQRTITLWFAAQNFLTPTAPPSILDTVSMTINPKTGDGTASIQTCVDQSNGTAPPGGTFCATAAANSPFAPASMTNVPFNRGNSYSADFIGTIPALTSPFALSQKITVVLSGSSEAEVRGSQLLQVVPEPASIVLLGTGLVLAATAFRKKLARRS